jgi:hypothetical protein
VDKNFIIKPKAEFEVWEVSSNLICN